MLRRAAVAVASDFESERERVAKAIRESGLALRGAVSSADRKAALAAARTLKSYALTVGALGLLILARRAEIRARVQGPVGVRAILSSLEAELAAVCDALERPA